MTIITVQNFTGMAEDRYDAGSGQFASSKQFDILTYPGRLQPLRGMVADTTGTSIGNIIVASDGLMYGVGVASGNSKLYQRSGYGASDVWATMSNWSSGHTVKYPLLVEYKNAFNARTIYFAGDQFIASVDPTNSIAVNTDGLTFTNIGQGFVHPKDKILYIPYDNKIATVNGSVAATLTAAAFTFPLQYTIPCLTNYGNYLAVPGYSLNGIGVAGSIVYLWGRDTSITTVDESINWGAGQLKVLNNLNGALIGISSLSAAVNGSVQDYDAIQIKVYSGGQEPEQIFEIQANHLAGSLSPSCTINPRVNFIYKNRLYFSVNINPNDGISNSYYGLWSVGRNKKTGRYSVILERVATNTNTETGVIAASIAGDFVSMCHTSEGTLTYTINGQTSSSTYAATSVIESAVNPNMSDLDKVYKKQLHSVAVHSLPLTTGQQIIMKYRVDSQGSVSDWLTCFTKTSTSPNTDLTTYETSVPALGQFTAGRNYEFRLESTGGAVITGFTYAYTALKTNLNT